jgi:hypothetical protein
MTRDAAWKLRGELQMLHLLHFLLDALADAGAHALGWSLGKFRDKLEKTPQRDWSEIGWPYRVGRLLLIASSLGIIFGPIAYGILR